MLKSVNLWLAVGCVIGAVALGTCYAGGMESQGVEGGEIGALIFAVIFAVLAFVFWRKRNSPMR